MNFRASQPAREGLGRRRRRRREGRKRGEAWAARGERRSVGGVEIVGAAVVEKGPAQRVPQPPPIEGPRSIQTRSNKAFPLSSLQNTKQNRERERETEGEREKERERER